MVVNWIRQIGLFLILILLQVWVFNQIHLFGVAIPLVYIYFVIKLPSEMNRSLVLALSFFLGLTIDMFSYTLGMSALASTAAGFSRYYSLKLFSPRDMPDIYIPSIRTLGVPVFLRYAGAVVLLHQVIYFITESLSMFDIVALLLKMAGSFILTMLLIFALESIHFDFLKK